MARTTEGGVGSDDVVSGRTGKELETMSQSSHEQLARSTSCMWSRGLPGDVEAGVRAQHVVDEL
jgi:hypothetical protein